MPSNLPKLPELLSRKIYKTGQTRGADDDEIYQNRVLRNSTVLIPFSSWTPEFNFPDDGNFENGFIVLIPPEIFFKDRDIDKKLDENSLNLGENALVFYETREQWVNFNPENLGWVPAQSRNKPLLGNYIARIPATTATEGGGKIVRGFSITTSKGAGVRVYEYADKKTIELCRLQLEAIFWHCFDASEITLKYGMVNEDISTRKREILSKCTGRDLLDYSRLIHSRILDQNHNTVCPLCLERLSSEGFFSRMVQAIGREVPDLTVTEINLFHIKELRIGEYNHSPYNLGWGHHHCNVVTRDTGIDGTISWMKILLKRNGEWELSRSI